MAFRLFGREFGGPPDPPPVLAAFLAEAAAYRDWYALRRSDELAAGRTLLGATPEQQVTIVLLAVEHLATLRRRGLRDFAKMAALGKLIGDILRRDLPFSEGDVTTMLGHARRLTASQGLVPMASMVKTAERFVRKRGLAESLRRALVELNRSFGPAPTRQEERRLRARLEALLGDGAADLDISAGEPWARAVTASLEAMTRDECAAWRRLLAYAQAGGGATPSRKWLKRAEPLVSAVGAEALREQVIEWFAHVTPPRGVAALQQMTMADIAAASLQVTEALLNVLDERGRAAWHALMQMGAKAEPDDTWLGRFRDLSESAGGALFFQRLGEQMRQAAGVGPLLPERNAEALRGLVWMCSLLAGDRRLAVAIGDLAQGCLKKVPSYGAYSSKVGNACIWVLGRMDGIEPVAQLGRLKQRVKYPVSLRIVEKALAEAARRASISPEDLEEMAVPTYGLTEPGVGHTSVAGYSATVRVTGVDAVELLWTSPGGRQQKTVPQEVQRTHGDELKQLKRGVKDITTMLPAQRDRIERLFFGADRHWAMAEWRKRYLDHPLLSVVSRRLIWHLQEGERTALGIFHAGRLVGVDGMPLDGLGDQTQVRLFHPLGFPPETVLAWRVWLGEHEVRQPFKQAHREIYVITDAELRTSTYSNRFAAHIVRQHQFAALCRERGWRYHLQGGWDSHNVPTLPLPRFGLQAEFWVEPLLDNDDEQSAMGIYMQIATDQVRFTDAEGSPRPLSEVPALVFSEVMRDVDLFVGVTSIGADPAWADQGDERARTYWQSYAFGELNATAATRREVLAALLPKLKIASRCALEGRFLKVQGQLRSYKIHLGSGNILMEPNDRYLCIVPDRRISASASRGLVLPFEGDTTLSVIISKALLLAGDDRITDETIVRQIKESWLPR